jgi:hypothetical protein
MIDRVAQPSENLPPAAASDRRKTCFIVGLFQSYCRSTPPPAFSRAQWLKCQPPFTISPSLRTLRQKLLADRRLLTADCCSNIPNAPNGSSENGGSSRSPSPPEPLCACGSSTLTPKSKATPSSTATSPKNWMLHGIYGRTIAGHIVPTLIRLPGYPLFLILCFRLFGIEHYNAVMYAQVAIDLATCLLIAALARRIWSPRAGWWALWLAVLCPFTANYTGTPLTETLELFSIALAFYAFDRFLATPRWSWALTLAFAWSYAAILRPDGALLAVALCPALVFCGSQRWGTPRMFRWALVCGLLSILPFIPWTLPQRPHLPCLRAARPALCRRPRRRHRPRLPALDHEPSASISPAPGKSTGMPTTTSSTSAISPHAPSTPTGNTSKLAP